MSCHYCVSILLHKLVVLGFMVLYLQKGDHLWNSSMITVVTISLAGHYLVSKLVSDVSSRNIVCIYTLVCRMHNIAPIFFHSIKGFYNFSLGLIISYSPSCKLVFSLAPFSWATILLQGIFFVLFYFLNESSVFFLY